jgi:CheY-like chemotaxis protein
MLVDDEPLVRMVAAEHLEDLGYTVLEAGDAKEALQVFDSNSSIALLITDVGLPGGMNGRQLAEAVREKRPDLDVLFITGYAENAVFNHGHLDRGMHMMSKPFQMDAFAAKVADLIKN